MSAELAGLNKCPVCAETLRRHRYARLASIIVNPKNHARLDAFLNDVKKRNWAEVLRFDEWQGDADIIELYGIKCPSSLFALILIRSPFELFDDDHILETECLTRNESATLESVTTKKNWKPLP